MSFESLKITRQYLNALEDLRFETPTVIQKKAIPVILAGQDVIGIAQTGTGKTAAYLLPLFKLLQKPQGQAIRLLIMVPTKELAMQVHQMAMDLGKYTEFRMAAIYGGVGWKKQAETIQAGLDLLIATPGRFKDLYLKGQIPVKKIKHLVLDEADRLMDMGFIRQLHDLLEVIPVKRQNLLFSATFNSSVEKLSQEFLTFPTKVQSAETATPAPNIEQMVYEVKNERSKIELLLKILEDRATYQRVLVFVRSKASIENISHYLSRKLDEDIRTIHSNKGQHSRINAMKAFKAGELRILVASDVASRGIDVTGVSHVINFDVPRNHEDYVHRIGRTGRANLEGKAISFMTDAEVYHIKQIEKLMGSTIPIHKTPFELPDFPTSKIEKKAMAMEIDQQKRRENPDYQGAFHARKRK